MQYLITGANRGIGLGLTQALAERGDRVFATARDPESADELNALAAKTSGAVEVVSLNVDDPESVANLSAQLGDAAIDVIINNAGRFTHVGEIGSLDYDGFLHDFRVNTLGPVRVTEAALPNLRKGDTKIVCNITSNLGSIELNSGDFYAYRASKTALNQVTRALAADLRDEGIIAFLMHPGWVHTDMGGPEADITIDESVPGILSVLDDIGPNDSGTYRAWDGRTLPW